MPKKFKPHSTLAYLYYDASAADHSVWTHPKG